MTSWRNTASQLAQDDLDELLNAVLPVAVGMLDRHGELQPFAATVAADAQTTQPATNLAMAEAENSLEALSLLHDGVAANKDSLRAAAYVANAQVAGSDTIQIELEHSEGIALVVLAPYTQRTTNLVELGELTVQLGVLQAWKTS
jgi:hypothetical protein